MYDAQMLGESTREKWHGAKVGDSGESFEFPMPEWLMAFDAEAHAYAVYERIAQCSLERIVEAKKRYRRCMSYLALHHPFLMKSAWFKLSFDRRI